MLITWSHGTPDIFKRINMIILEYSVLLLSFAFTVQLNLWKHPRNTIYSISFIKQLKCLIQQNICFNPYLYSLSTRRKWFYIEGVDPPCRYPRQPPPPYPQDWVLKVCFFFKTEGLMSQVLYCLLWNNYINSNVPLESSKKQGCGICTMPLVNFSLKKYYCSNFHKNKKIMLFPPPPFCIFFKYW